MVGSRSGMALIGILVAVVIVALLYLYSTGPLGTPVAAPSSSSPSPKAVISEAQIQVFRIFAQQVRTVVGTYEVSKGRKPASLDELAAGGFMTINNDPWGGTYYVKGNRLHCTGNPGISDVVW